MDITSLYPVIPNNEGLQALKYFFYQRPIKKPSSETLLRLAELVVTLDCFSFGPKYYKQINCVAMGTKMGPSYANLFVGFIENKFFSNYHGPLHSSSHPQHVKNTIPFPQFLRLRRLCSDDTDFNNKCEEMCQFFKKKRLP